MATNLASTDRLRRAPHVISVSQRGQTILFDTNELRYHILNDVASRVWHLVKNGPALGAVIDTICAEYDAPADQVRSDIVRLLTQLRSSGLVSVERRSLPVLGDAHSSGLPPLYATWIDEVLDGPLPEEPHATCSACAMAQPVGQAATANAMWYDPHVKCCSYMPVLPNFLVGQILSDTSESGAVGRETVRHRLTGASLVTPLGIGSFRDYAGIYKHASQLFGKNEALTCPHFIDASGGSCAIWRHRNSVCITFFCKLKRGAVSKAFWDALQELLGLVERNVALWCARELGLDARMLHHAVTRHATTVPTWVGEEPDCWGPWTGREELFYQESAELARNLCWRSIVDLGGLDLKASIKKVQSAHAALQQAQVPDFLRFAAVSQLSLASLGTVLSGYSLNDMLVISTSLANALDRFDGHHRTTEVLQTIASDTGEVIDSDFLRRLIDFNVLVTVPDLGVTELGVAVARGTASGNARSDTPGHS